MDTKELNAVTVDGMPRTVCAMIVALPIIEQKAKQNDVCEDCLAMLVLPPQGQDARRRLLAAGFEFNPGEMDEAATFIITKVHMQNHGLVFVVVGSFNSEEEAEAAPRVH